ncbi:MAG: hypothetical protein HQK85_06725 [Nitrospinae bacterium]|nr:hypothetical protein [Nitrospinota bacterium]
MSIVDNRNAQAKSFVINWIEKARAFTLTKEIKTKYCNELKILQDLIPIKSQGFRGVVLTAIVGKHLDPTYKPLKNFYDCNPRAIFEHGIYYALQEASIPCGKSDPLNVAKNIQQLDYKWAKGRRPESAAIAAVNYLTLLEATFKDKAKYDLLLYLYFYELYQFGISVNSQNFSLEMDAEVIPLQIGAALADFVIECPEGGTIPQFIVGILINMLRQDDSKYLSVGGLRESVFGTNTTSKKPADIWELMLDNSLGALYEITVKSIDKKRLDDCVDVIRKQDIKGKVITFICNMPHNIKALEITENHLAYRGVGFQFIDVKQFIVFSYCLLTTGQQKTLIENLQEFIFDSNRPTKTKQYWRDNITSAK